MIKPQYAVERLEELTKSYNRFVSTEVGQHQMWAAQFMGFEEPNRWMTSGGLGSYPASGKNWLGMLGMHGTYEANMSMHACDFMLCVGARFDDRITGRIDAFSPDSYKVHIDIDPSSVNKNITVEAPLIGDVSNILNLLNKRWKERGSKVNKKKLSTWWKCINDWKGVKSLSYENSSNVIKPQYAVERLEELTKSYNRFVSTEVGQHQMWAAQFMGFDEPCLLYTSPSPRD